MRKTTIKLDVDGVLRDCVTPLLDIYNKKHDDNVKYSEIKSWDIGQYLKKDEEYKNYFTKYPEQIFRDSPMYNPDTASILKSIQEKYKIHITTHQFKGLENYTVEWLHKNNIPYDYISFAKDKNVVKGNILIDDGVHNLDGDLGEVQICYSQPWNTEWKGLRVYGLEELAMMLGVNRK